MIRKFVPKIGRAGFDSMFFLISWSIWKERNARTFGDPSTQALRQIEKASTSYMSISSVLSVLYPARDHSLASSKIVSLFGWLVRIVAGPSHINTVHAN